MNTEQLKKLIEDLADKLRENKASHDDILIIGAALILMAERIKEKK